MKADEQLKLHKLKFKRDKDQETKDKILLQQYLPKILNFLCLLTQLKSGKSITQRTTKEEINTKF